MKRISLYLLLAALLAAVSCQKVVEFDLDQVPSQLVLNSLPSEGNQLFVNFTYSRFFLDSNTVNPARDVDIKMAVTNSSGTQVFSPSDIQGVNYFFPYTVQGDDSISVTIAADGNLVTAATRVPRPLQISNFNTLETWTLSPATKDLGFSGDSVLNLVFVSFDIDDYADQNNYYYISMNEHDSGSIFRPISKEFDTIDTLYRNLMLMCWDQSLIGPNSLLSKPVIDLPQGLSFYDRIVCNDKAFNGRKHTASVILLILVDTNEVEGFRHDFTLSVESISPDRVRYLLDIANATSLTSFFAEPAGVYSNVLVNGEQGLGLFSGISRRKFDVVVNPWPYPENLQNTKRHIVDDDLYKKIFKTYRAHR